MSTLFQKCTDEMKVPTGWKVSLITIIHKKVNKEDCYNFWEIAVTCKWNDVAFNFSTSQTTNSVLLVETFSFYLSYS